MPREGGGQKIDDLYYDLTVNNQRFRTGLTEADQAFGRFATSITSRGALLGSAVGVALAAISIKATKTAEDLETSFAEISTLVDESVVDVRQLRAEFLALARDLPITDMKDLTNGLYEIISAGVDASESVDFLRVAAKAAVGGVTEVQVAVDGLTTAVNAYSHEGLTATQASDKFFTAVLIGKTRFDEVSGSIGRVIGTSAALGVSLDELLATMATLTLKGLDTRRAFTGIQQLFANIIKPSTELQQSFPQIAEAFNRTRLEADGLVKFMSDLAVEVKENKEVAVQYFGSVEALNAALGLMQDGGKKAAEVLDRIKNSSGATDEAFRKVSAATSNLKKALGAEFQVLMINLGETILPAVNAALETMLELMSLINGTARSAELDGFVATVGNLGRQLEFMLKTGRTEDLKRFAEAMTELVGAPGLQRRGAIGAAAEGDLSRVARVVGVNLHRALLDLPDEKLRVLYDGLLAIARSGRVASDDLTILGTALARLSKRLGAPKPIEVPTVGDEGGGGGGGGGVIVSDEQLEAIATARQGLAQLTETLTDDLQFALEDYREAFAKVFGKDLPEEVKQFLDGLERQLATTRALEPLDAQVKALETELAEALKVTGGQEGVAIEVLAEPLNLAQQEAEKLLGSAQEGTAEWAKTKALLDRIYALQRQIAGVTGQLGEFAADTATSTGKTLDQLIDQARTIEAAVRGALQLADAFGLVDKRVADILTGIGQTAANIPSLIKVLDTFGSKGVGIQQLVGAALPVIGGIASVVSGLFGGGPSAEELRRQQLLEDNNNAIRVLTRTIGELGVVLGDVSGERIAAVTEAVNIGAAPGGGLQAFQPALVRLGLTMEDVREVAEGLGISFAGALPTFGELNKLAEALAQTELTRFAQTFGGQLEAIRLQFDLFDITDPIDQLKALQQLAVGEFGTGALSSLAGVNLGTEAGRKQAEALIKSLFQQLREGTLTPAQLGGLSTSQFVELLREMESLIDSIEEQTEAEGETQQFGVDRTVTEVTALRQVSIALTQVDLLRQIVENTLPLRLGGSGGTMVIQVTVPPGTENPEQFGTAVAEPIATEVNRLLGAAYQKSLTSSGVVVRN